MKGFLEQLRWLSFFLGFTSFILGSLLEEGISKKRKRTARPIILSHDEDSDSAPQKPSTQHLNAQRPMVEIPIIDIRSNSDESGQNEKLVISSKPLKGKAHKKPSHNQDKSRKHTLSSSGIVSISSFQRNHHSPDDRRKDQLHSNLFSLPEDAEQASFYINKGSHQSPTGNIDRKM